MFRTSRAARLVAFNLTVAFALFGTAFVIAETVTDPGGLSAVLLSASWAIPMVAGTVYAVLRPVPAGTVLTVAAVVIAAFVAIEVAFRIVPRGAGPVASISVFAVAVALGFLGLRRPARAGWLLLLVGAVNLGNGPSGVAVAVPVLAIGGLYLLAAFRESGQGHATHSGRMDSGPVATRP